MLEADTMERKVSDASEECVERNLFHHGQFGTSPIFVVRSGISALM
jgi:hypothetical protein